MNTLSFYNMIISDLLRNSMGTSITIIYDAILLYITFQFIIVQLLSIWGLGKNGEWVVLQAVLYFTGLEHPTPKATLTGHESEVICVAVLAELGLVLSGSKGNVTVHHLPQKFVWHCSAIIFLYKHLKTVMSWQSILNWIL